MNLRYTTCFLTNHKALFTIRPIKFIDILAQFLSFVNDVYCVGVDGAGGRHGNVQVVFSCSEIDTVRMVGNEYMFFMLDK
jgi:hypothetical protein